MIKLSFFFLSLFMLISCSSISFKSSNIISTSFDYKDDKQSEVSVEISKPFYMWGSVPSEQVVEVDKVFVSKGFKEISNLEIKEVYTAKKFMWMLATFGMYYPQTFMLSAKAN